MSIRANVSNVNSGSHIATTVIFACFVRRMGTLILKNAPQGAISIRANVSDVRIIPINVVLLQIKPSANCVPVAVASTMLVITGVMQPRGGAKNKISLAHRHGDVPKSV